MDDKIEKMVNGVVPVKRLKLTGLIWRENDVYVSQCPELGVASAGDTVEEALANF
jgi:hypothetical protein